MVGYQVRLESKQSDATRLLFCTTGVLLSRLRDDPMLEDVRDASISPSISPPSPLHLPFAADALLPEANPPPLPLALARATAYLTHPMFNTYHSEHQMLRCTALIRLRCLHYLHYLHYLRLRRPCSTRVRYIFKLANRDISLTHCMIPLGSCTMKVCNHICNHICSHISLTHLQLNATSEMMPITWSCTFPVPSLYLPCTFPVTSLQLNATSEMMPITWPTINGLHPFAPEHQTVGYKELITSLEDILCELSHRINEWHYYLITE